MKIYLIIGQRYCKYVGEYAPEVLDACDEFTYDENPQSWLDEKLAFYRKDTELQHVGIITLEVPTKEILKRIIPYTTTIKITPLPENP